MGTMVLDGQLMRRSVATRERGWLGAACVAIIGASGLSQGCTAQSCLVDVRAVDGPVPAVTAHALPEFAAMR